MKPLKNLIRRLAALALSLAAVALVSGSVFFVDSLGSPAEAALREATGSGVWKIREVVEILSYVGVSFDTVYPSANPSMEGMDPNWSAYELTDGAKTRYTLILGTFDGDFTAVLDDHNQLLFGMIDSGLTPRLFPPRPTPMVPQSGSKKHPSP